MYQLLTVLIERSPAVVTNTELDELIWPNVYVARTSLTRLVSELRTLLGDAASSGTIIRTVYKSGYAFAAATSSPGRHPAEATEVSLLWESQVIPLPPGQHIAGRAADCSVIVDATTVSRRHARFTVGPDLVMVEDLDSTNGTQVNKVPVTDARPLKHGDKVMLGEATLAVRVRRPSANTTMMTRPGRPARSGA